MDLELARLSAHERYKLLIGLVIPRPIAWVSTRSENG
ncbi:MAG: flavin reductase family protein, partial [Betaproteobacteria bacterium]|nr:flavin reductase family protein [Betaproteobacteria bacterium]